MGRVYDGIDERQRAWIAAQALFFVGTAPLDAGGHVNVSPKGPIGSLRVLGEHRLAYLDAVGSGVETYEELLAEASFDEPAVPAARRSIIEVEVERVSDSCGYGVPLMTHEGRREHLGLWAQNRLSTRGDGAMADYQADKNAVSIDGLPAVPAPVPR